MKNPKRQAKTFSEVRIMSNFLPSYCQQVLIIVKMPMYCSALVLVVTVVFIWVSLLQINTSVVVSQKDQNSLLVP